MTSALQQLIRMLAEQLLEEHGAECSSAPAQPPGPQPAAIDLQEA